MVQQDISLKPYNTFSMDVRTKYFASFNSIDELAEILGTPKYHNLPKLVLGGGSNMLFTKDFEGITLQNRIKGIVITKEEDGFVFIKSGAGEVWHDFVLHTLNLNLGGLENLSLIPGSVGAAPMQNIGAYGAEIKDVFSSLDAYEISTGKVRTFSKEDCAFGYRESVFKNIYKEKYIILSVTFRLKKEPTFNTTYGAIEEELKNMGVKSLSVKSISDAVCNIRRSKLPDPKVTGNAGSFFKNPTVPAEKFEALRAVYPDLVGYPQPGSGVKLAAGWMIERCGWKGKTHGNAGVHPKQALVLINRGNALGKEVLDLSQLIKQSVLETFGVQLETEVNIL